MDTFTWEVSNNTAGTTRFTPLKAQFGEGYKQVAADGLNMPARTINIDIGPIEQAEAVAIHNFLDAQRGLPFLWTPIYPLPQVQKSWTCETFGFKKLGGLINGITATFELFNTP